PAAQPDSGDQGRAQAGRDGRLRDSHRRAAQESGRTHASPGGASRARRAQALVQGLRDRGLSGVQRRETSDLKPDRAQAGAEMTNAEVKVLVVDDVNAMRIQVKDLLLQIGFRDIQLAVNGEEAKSLIRQSAGGFQLILSDWHMEPGAGIDLVKW